jgi:hypothetical protein
MSCLFEPTLRSCAAARGAVDATRSATVTRSHRERFQFTSTRNVTGTVCIITPGHLASAPRVVKEADALVASGLRVHVVAGRHFEPAIPLDARILREAGWGNTIIDYRRGAAVSARKLIRRWARIVSGKASRLSDRLAARAHHAEAFRFGESAARIPADLYIGHCLAGLAAAARAANIARSRYGFDAEDFHDEETIDCLRDSLDGRLSRFLQARLLPGAAHVTAASPLIGAELQAVYGVSSATVLNTFPLAHGPTSPAEPGPITPDHPARLYWFSQTIGPGRGLEAMIATLGHLRTPAVLTLRGFVSEAYRERLVCHALEHRVRYPISFLPPGEPAEMTRLAATAHLGLSLEESLPRNRDLCLTNKIFVYLLAAIPQLMTPTSAQCALADALGNAAILADTSGPSAAAAQLDALLSDSRQLARARTTAWELGRGRFNWEQEQHVLIASVQGALGRPSCFQR